MVYGGPDDELTASVLFLREREVVHFQRFGEALRIVQDNMRQNKYVHIDKPM